VKNEDSLKMWIASTKTRRAAARALPAVVAIATGACSGTPSVVECRYDSSCDRFVGGRCMESAEADGRFCAYPDASCESGMRWSDLQVDESISGECVGEEHAIDASVVDGPGDSPDARWPQGTWSDPVKLAFSLDSEAEGGGYESANGLELYFTSRVPAGLPDIYKVTRGNASSPWGTTRTAITIVNTTDQVEGGPALTPDGLELYFGRASDIYVSTRTSLSGAWMQPDPLSLEGGGVDLLSDGLTMYYSDGSGSTVCTEPSE
jgi:hypothetical protein